MLGLVLIQKQGVDCRRGEESEGGEAQQDKMVVLSAWSGKDMT